MDKIVTINLKLKNSIKNKFKKKVREEHSKSMQDILGMFVLSYIENPEQFCIKLGVKENETPVR